MYCPLCHLPHVSSLHTMHYGSATLHAVSLPGSEAPNNSLLLFVSLAGCGLLIQRLQLQTFHGPFNWNYSEEKKQGAKYRWLQKACRITSPFLRWTCRCRTDLPLHTCLMIKHPCLGNLSVTLHVRFRLLLCFLPLTWDFQSIFYVEILASRRVSYQTCSVWRGRLASFTCTQTQLPPLSPMLKALRDFTFLLCISAPSTPVPERENDHRQTTCSRSPVLGCWQQARVEGVLLFVPLKWVTVNHAFYYTPYLSVLPVMPSLTPCVIHRDWHSSASPSMPS